MKLKILMLEPFYGGSHKDFVQGYQSHSRHEVIPVTLPDRFWKWRMRGASLFYLEQIKDLGAYDVIFAGDMMDVTDFKALAGPRMPPLLLYFHENQLTYPLSPLEKRDFHLGFTNIVSAFAADRVLFNSRFHMDAFLKEARHLIRRMPDARPEWMMKSIIQKSDVVYPGCRTDITERYGQTDRDDPPLIVWNHRWEFDKSPDQFFRVMEKVHKRGIPFSLAILGEQQDVCPEIFDRSKKMFEKQIRVFGYESSRADYVKWLQKALVVVSCAIQENFGISVVEAVRYGCFPLLPDRLSYPEIMPEQLHSEILYQNETQLEEKLVQVLTSPEKVLSSRRFLSEKMKRYSWHIMAPEFDTVMEQLAAHS